MQGECKEAMLQLMLSRVDKEEASPNTLEDIKEEEEDEDLRDTMLDLQIELDNLKWRCSILEAEKLAKTLDSRDL